MSYLHKFSSLATPDEKKFKKSLYKSGEMMEITMVKTHVGVSKKK